jgi:threonine dehydrogenase-like Zn-dependent dehydrogenase
MQALCWNGPNNLAVEQVPDPTILNPRDIILKVRLSAACGSDTHLVNGYVPTMQKGDIIGHEFMGEVVETGPEVKKLRKGDRAVVIPIIGCGNCWYCKNELWSLCDNTNPNGWFMEKVFGKSPAGMIGYSHAFGGYAGSHAEYIRVPMADYGAFKIPDNVSDEAALFVSDALATGYMAADMCNIHPGDVVAVWGCGGVGQMAIRCAYLLGAQRVIAIDRLPNRLAMAHDRGKAEVLDYTQTNVTEALDHMTGGRGPDACIDAVGMEAEGGGVEYAYDRAKQALRLETDRPIVLRQIIRACRKGGTLSVVGIYGGFVDKFPMGPLMNKALTLHTGQQHGQKYAARLLDLIARGEIDPTYIITHRMRLADGPEAYRLFINREDNCVRPVFDMRNGRA